MLQLTLENSSPLSVSAISAQTSTRFGLVTEVLVSDTPPQVRDNVKVNALMQIDGQTFFFSKSNGFQVYDAFGNELEIELPPDDMTDDEERLNILIGQLGDFSEMDGRLRTIIAAIFGVVDGKGCGDWCFTNKGCRLTGCGKNCLWGGGFDCDGYPP